jgi:hypothetical protein
MRFSSLGRGEIPMIFRGEFLVIFDSPTRHQFLLVSVAIGRRQAKAKAAQCASGVGVLADDLCDERNLSRLPTFAAQDGGLEP